MLAADYGTRGNDFFGIMRRSPYYDATKLNLILGVQSSNPFNSRLTHNASANHDMLAIAPYMATRIDDYTTNEQLFGSLFAEASWWSRSARGSAQEGRVRMPYDMVNPSTRPVPLIVYEDNLHTTQGSITQDVLDSFTPSVGAGLAVANEMLIMLRDEKIRDQCLFSLGGYRYTRDDGKTALIWGTTRDMGVTDRKRPQFLALKLANEALAGDMMVTAQSGDDPTWNEPLTNRRARAVRGLPDTRVVTTSDAGRIRIWLFERQRLRAIGEIRRRGRPIRIETIHKRSEAFFDDPDRRREIRERPPAVFERCDDLFL